MKARYGTMLAAGAVLLATLARGGHEAPVYPSFYPHEIEIRTAAPKTAGDLLVAGKLHAYVGAVPDFTAARPASIAAVESLGALLVVHVDAGSPLAGDRVAACAAIAGLLREMAARAGEGFVFHPYPVTPWHGDYLHHADRAEAQRERVLAAAPPPAGRLAIRAGSTTATRLVPREWLAGDGRADITVEEVSAAQLVAEAMLSANGWLGPPWVRSGWFQAHGALARFAAAEEKPGLDAAVRRLETGEFGTAVERIEAERALVASLGSGCRAAVAGYTVRQELYGTEFTAGLENIAADALQGFESPMFLRTVKLKDFPWNGWLQLGTADRPRAAWNPIAGFSDRFGRLTWYAVGDPAAIPSPYEAAWTLNRISEVEVSPQR